MTANTPHQPVADAIADGDSSPVLVVTNWDDLSEQDREFLEDGFAIEFPGGSVVVFLLSVVTGMWAFWRFRDGVNAWTDNAWAQAGVWVGIAVAYVVLVPLVVVGAWWAGYGISVAWQRLRGAEGQRAQG